MGFTVEGGRYFETNVIGVRLSPNHSPLGDERDPDGVFDAAFPRFVSSRRLQMPVLEEMDPTGFRDQAPKKPESKNALITSFFKSPKENSSQKLDKKSVAKHETNEASKDGLGEAVDAESDLNSSLSDFDLKPKTAHSKGTHKKKQMRKSQAKDKSRRASKTNAFQEESKHIEAAEPRGCHVEEKENTSKEIRYEEFVRLHNCQSEQTEDKLNNSTCGAESEDILADDTEDEVLLLEPVEDALSEGTKATKSGSAPGSAGQDECENFVQEMNSSNLVTETLKTCLPNNKSQTVCEEIGGLDGVVISTDTSVPAVREPKSSVRRKTRKAKKSRPTQENVKGSETSEENGVEVVTNGRTTQNIKRARTPEQETPPKKVKRSFCTILAGSQVASNEKGARAPIVITVNYPDSPSNTPQKPAQAFSIFDKCKAKSGLGKEVTDLTEPPQTGQSSAKEAEMNTLTKERKGKLDFGGVSEDKELQKKVTADRLASLDKLDLRPSGKSTQSTLVFGKNGLAATKSATSENEVSKKDSPNARKMKKGGGKRSEKTKGQEVEGTRDEFDVTETHGRRDKRVSLNRRQHSNPKGIKTNRTASSDTDTDIQVLDDSDSQTKRKKGRERKTSELLYSSEIMESPVSVKKAPIKLRLTRVSKSATNKDGSASRKVSKAQELLQRAKKKGSPGKNKKSRPAGQKASTRKATNDVLVSPLRRSSRACSRIASEAISLSLERQDKKVQKSEDSCPQEKAQTKKISSSTKTQNKKTVETPADQTTKTTPSKRTPSKRTPAKPKKKEKLAPIFMKKGDAPIVVESDEETPPPKVIAVDPEKLRAQRDFLMSGIPEQMKLARTCAVAESEHLPFPRIPHQRQVPASCSDNPFNPWNLPVPDWKLSMVEPKPFRGSAPDLSNLSSVLGVRTAACLSSAEPKQVKQESELPEATVQYLLGEINLRNRDFPVRRMYKQLKNKAQPSRSHRQETEVQPPSKDDCGIPTAEQTTRTSRKRKLEMDLTENEIKRSLRQRSKRRKGGDDVSEELVKLEKEETRDGEKPEKEARPHESSVGEKQSENVVISGPEVLWTEKYHPKCGSDVLGNSKQVKKMQAWLKEWKERTDLEMKKLRKQLKKDARRGKISAEEAKKKLGSAGWSDDSDFDLSSCSESSDSEEDEEENRLCNTMVLVGPPGVGKTSTVYALAAELGYKVFEVNASSRRNGQQILAQLREATQSHQVSKENLDAMYTTFAALSKKATGDKVETEAKKMPAAFAKFFKSGSQAPCATGESSEKRKPGKPENVSEKKSKSDVSDLTRSKKKRAKKPPKTITEHEPHDTPSQAKGLNLSSTSLILFEEVDVVFEEDKGFWAAIQTFISTAKRPIILTAHGASVCSLVDGRHEVTALKPTTPENIASYLQTLCLTNNVRTDFHDMVSLVNFLGADIRKCMNTVQFWMDSGAGTVRQGRLVNFCGKFLKRDSDNSQQPDAAMSTPAKTPTSKLKAIMSKLHPTVDSEDEFISLPVNRRRRRAVIVSDDDTSRDSLTASPRRGARAGDAAVSAATPEIDVVNVDTEDSQCGGADALRGALETYGEDVETATDLEAPLVHTGCVDHAVLCHSRHSTALETLKNRSESKNSLSNPESFETLQLLGNDAVYNHLAFLLPLPRTKLRPQKCAESDLGKGWKPKTVRRIIRPESDLFDSDSASDDEKEKENTGKSKSTVRPDKPKDACASVMMKSLSALSAMYDTFSFCDAHLSTPTAVTEGVCLRPTRETWCPARQSSGTDDTRCVEDGVNWTKPGCLDQIVPSVQYLNVRTANEKLRDCLEAVVKLPSPSSAQDRLSIPVPTCRLEGVQAKDETSAQASLKQARMFTAGYVAECLPTHSQGDCAAVALDYLPAARLICRSEQLRLLAKTKRRFLHYFDSISFGVARKQSVLDVLCSSFT